MSADNGIYILKTNTLSGKGYEYRVKHLQNVEDYKWDHASNEPTGNQDAWIRNARVMWEGCEVFTDKDECIAEAERMENNCYILEYGICYIDINRVFDNSEAFTETHTAAYEDTKNQNRQIIPIQDAGYREKLFALLKTPILDNEIGIEFSIAATAKYNTSKDTILIAGKEYKVTSEARETAEQLQQAGFDGQGIVAMLKML